MKECMFVVRNTLSGLYDGIFLYPTEKLAAVELCRVFSQRAPLDESILFCLGSFDNEVGSISLFPSPSVVSWDTRRLVETPATSVPVSDMEKRLASS